MMKKTILIVLLVIVGVIASRGGAPLVMRHLDTASGLSNTRINSIYKDSGGLLWIGTSSGLFRYDGYSVRMYGDDHPDGKSVLNNYVEEIQEDSLHRLWIFAEGKYHIYNPATGETIEDIAPMLKEAGIEGDVTNVLAGDVGPVWIAVRGAGVYGLDLEKGKAMRVTGLDTGCPVSDMARTGNGIACVTTDGKLTFFDPKTGKAVGKCILPAGGERITGSENLFATYVDRDDRLWVFCNDIIMVYDVKAGKWLDDLLPGRNDTGVVKNLFQDHAGRLWIARDHRGLAEIVRGQDGFRIIDYPESGELKAHNTVICFSEDSHGTLWLGTFKQGLFSYNESVEKFGMENIPDVNCMTIAPGSDSVWVGTDACGIWKWNLADNSKVRIQDPLDGDTPSAVTCMTTSGDGTLYFGTFSKGLRRYRDGRFTRIATGTELDNSFPWSLAFDRYGNLWVGTLGAGVFRMDPATGKTVEFRNSNGGPSTDYVTSIIQSKDGKMYFGTSYGMTVYDPATGKMTSTLNEDNHPNPSERVINQIYEDSRGLLWLATRSGLRVLDRRSGNLHDVSVRDGRNQFFILGITEDSSGSMWVAEGSNIINLKVDYNARTGDLTAEPHVYDAADGVQDCGINQRSFVNLPGGEIAVGGLYGINRISPHDIKFNMSHPKVMFTDLYMSGRRLMAGDEVDGRTVFDKGLNSGAVLEFDHNPEEFTVFFATDNYALPEKTVFRYKLEGFNDEWISCPRGVNHVTYTNLSPGDYRLLVKAENGDGFESSDVAILPIHVAHPFWVTPWAYIIYAVIAFLVMAVIARLVRVRERRHFEQKRKEDAMQKQDEINQLKFKFFTNISHDLRTPLTLIVSPLEAMLKESTDEKQTRRLTLMRNNAMRLLALVNQLLDFRKTEMAGLQLSPSKATK